MILKIHSIRRPISSFSLLRNRMLRDSMQGGRRHVSHMIQVLPVENSEIALHEADRKDDFGSAHPRLLGGFGAHL